MGTAIKRFIIIAIFTIGMIVLYLFLVQKMNNEAVEQAEHIEAKAKAELIQAQREQEERTKFSSENLAKLKAQRQAEAEASADIGRKRELERFNREIAQHQAEERKKAEFERQYKPRAECKDPNLEGARSVKCIDEKMAAREKFNKTH